MVVTRHLEFFATDNDLGKDLDIVLTFLPLDKTKLYKRQFPVAWKILRFHKTNAGQEQTFDVTYLAELGVSKVQGYRDGKIVEPTISNHIDLGQTVSITEAGFSDPTPKTSPGEGLIQVVNEISGDPIDLTVGLFTDGTYKPVVVERYVEHKESMAVSFEPKLYAYAVSGALDSEMFKTELRHDLGSWMLTDSNISVTGVTRFHVHHNADNDLVIDIVKPN